MISVAGSSQSTTSNKGVNTFQAFQRQTILSPNI